MLTAGLGRLLGLLMGAMLVTLSAAPARAAVTSLHAGPVDMFREEGTRLDPCVDAPADFARATTGDVASDWCAAIGLAGESSQDLDLELPEGTALRLPGAGCAAPPDCLPSTQAGTAALRSTGPFGAVEERGRLYAHGPSSLTMVLDSGAARPDRSVTLNVSLTTGVTGGQVLRIPPLPLARQTEAGAVELTPELLILRLWGPGAAGSPTLQLGGCDALQRVRVTGRPTDGLSAPTALVDEYVLTTCGSRARTDLALQSGLQLGRLPPVAPFFATQRAERAGRRLGSLRAVLVYDLPIGTELRTSVEPGVRRVIRRATVGVDGGATVRWDPPLAIDRSTRLVLTAARPGAQTVRLSYRFVLHQGALRAKRLAP